MELTPVMQKFILHWGEMGARWGINRTVAQIHALLYLASEPMHAEEITQTLSVARSNVSTSLRELQGWGVVKVTHVMGDRRDHFVALHDPWDMFFTIMEKRKEREIDPTIDMLRELNEEAAASNLDADQVAQQRIDDMLSFVDTMDRWYNQLKMLPQPALVKFIKLGKKVPQMLGIGA